MRQPKTTAQAPPSELADKLRELLIGQDHAVDAIVPFVEVHQSGLAPAGRPIGVVMLLGPTGTGKTKTVEALAEVLHGSSKNLLKVDCGEFQMEHEVAKLIGAPPGYLGHRETQPMLNQAKVNAVASDQSDISLILFDEIEKSAASMSRLLLGILDKASLRLGDNSTVCFERCIIFMTSNLGAKEIAQALNPAFGLEAMAARAVVVDTTNGEGDPKDMSKIGMAAVKRKFSPEFVNRVDAVITYKSLTREHCRAILDLLLLSQQRLINNRMGLRAFRICVTDEAKEALLDEGCSKEWGARELKRAVQRPDRVRCLFS